MSWGRSVADEFMKNRRWPKYKQVVTLRKISMLLSHHVRIDQVCEILESHGNKHDKVLAKNIRSVIDSGFSLELAFKEHLSQSAYQALCAGVVSEDLAKAFSDAAANLEINGMATTKVFWHFLKPTCAIIAVALAVAAYGMFFVPFFSDQLPLAKWPWLPKAVASFSEVIIDYGMALLVFIVLLLVGVFLSLPLVFGGWRNHVDGWVVFRQYRLLVSSSFLQSLSNLLFSNISLKESLSVIRKQASPFLYRHITLMMRNADETPNVGAILDTGLLLPEQIHVIKQMTDSGHIDSKKVIKSSASIHSHALEDEVGVIKSIGTNLLLIIGFSGASILCFSVFGLFIEMATNNLTR